MKKQIFISYSILIICITAFYFFNYSIEKRHFKETLAWQAERQNEILNSNYLKLVKRFYAGNNFDTYKIGQTQNNDWQVDILDFPAELGTLSYQKDEIRFSIKDKKHLQTAVQPASFLTKITDKSKAYLSEKIELKEYSLNYTWNSQEGLKFNVFSKKNFKVIVPEATDYYLPNRKFKVKAKFIAQSKPIQFGQANRDTLIQAESPGYLSFKINGIAYTLSVYSKNDRSMFLVFGDKSNGKESYAAGRFLEVPLPDEKGNTTINFNQAYNPWCAFNSNTSCPLSIAENTLDLHIYAGEKYRNHFLQL